MQDITTITNEIIARLRSARSPILVSHANPDGDSLGSALGFSGALKKTGIAHAVFCPTPLPPQFSYLPGYVNVQIGLEAFRTLRPDLIVTFDASDLRRCGLEECLATLSAPLPFIVIDHHKTEGGFGVINLVETGSSSTAEIVLRIMKSQGWPLDPDIATCLLQGVIYDTWGFSNLGTTPESFSVASELMAAGARFPEVMRATFVNKSVPALQLWGDVLQRLRRDPRTNWAVTVVTRADLERFHLTSEDVSGLANFLNALADTEAVMILQEAEPGMISASLRTTRADVDVSKYAQLFGGGGHAKAAGFKVPGRLTLTPTGTWQIIE